MQETYIVSAVRSPLGRYAGSLIDVSPVDLAAHIMQAAVKRAGLEGKDLDFYMFGHILKHGHGQLLPRHAAMKAGIPPSVDGYGLDMLCSSGMMCVMNAATGIKAGEYDLVMAGGVESMSQTGFYLSHKARYGYGLSAMSGSLVLSDVLLDEGLTDPMTGELMGQQADRLVDEYGVTREALDEVACLSHRRATAAVAAGWFQQEIEPFEIKTRKGTAVLDKDEGIRPETTMESLAQLRPAFSPTGKLTAGNSSQLSDGAAALILASQRAVAERGLKPLGKIVGGTWLAGESWRFAEMPIAAIKKLLDRLNLKIDDIDLFENNEAFALNSVLLKKQLGVSYDKMNVYGGAIALGHPVGCSGARIIVTLLNALEQKGGRRGLASLCHGTGGATVVAVERL